jgi:serine/threonine-protein kinase
VPAVEQLPGPTAFGKYTLLAKLATGGMGEVFLARASADAGFQKLLVIKRLLPHLTDHPQFVNMFLDEARLAAQLHHPNICQIFELGRVNVDHYMSMEYVEGIQLATLLRGRSRSPKLSDPRLTCALLAQACEALHYAHNLRMADGSLAGVVHRDVNPKNIMVTSAGTIKVLDFGVAKARGKLNLSRTGTLKGTYSYMSPEQLRGEALDRRSDIFSLGIIAWESVTGRRLFKRPTDVEVWRAIAEKPIPRASALAENVSEELDGSIARALSRDHTQRFATAREFALALEESLSSYGAPLSTVAIAAEVERCFARELEELRTVVMRAQRLIGEGDDDDDEFDGPTRLFSDGRLQLQLAELEKKATVRQRPELPRLRDEAEESGPVRADSPAIARERPTVPDLSQPSDHAETLLGVGVQPRSSNTAPPEPVTADLTGRLAASEPPPPAPPPRLPPRLPPVATAPAPLPSNPIAPPHPNPVDDVSVRPKTNWTMILIALIAAVGLAVVGHYAWTKINEGDDSGGPVQFGD